MTRRRMLCLESLESRHLLAPLNVPVNDPARDTAYGFTQYDPAVTVTAGGQVLVAYSDSSTGTLSGVRLQTALGVSSDQGQTVLDRGVFTNDAYWSDHPSVAADRVSGRTYIAVESREHAGLLVYRSDDNGQTLLAPVGATAANSYLVDPQIAVDNTTGSGQGTVYLLGRYEGGTNDPDKGGLYLVRSTDGGDTWSTPQQLVFDALASGGRIVIGPDHSVSVFWLHSVANPHRNHGPNTLYMRRSVDFGATFGPRTTVALQHGTAVHGPVSTFYTNGHVQVAVNPVNGDLYGVFYDNPDGDDKADIMFVMSSDQGSTWTAPRRANDDDGLALQFKPTIAVAPDGKHLLVAFRDTRMHEATQLASSFGSLGTISGHTVTFHPNFRISSVATPIRLPNDLEDHNNYFGIELGDADSATADADNFYYAWSDRRNTLATDPRKHQSDVFLARISTRGPAGPYVVDQSPAGLYVDGNIASVTVEFAWPMDRASFNVADDVFSF
ncbi:MAG TPA: sialidase family protein, partial [Planctomycetaceae bacterium]|nr:sialidase family protein [Planctomycetaceae bacterium]